MRSRWVALPLAVLLGMLGAHNFYLGNWDCGGLQLVFTLLAVAGVPWIGLFVLAWVVVEIVLIVIGHEGYDGSGEGEHLTCV